MQQSEHVGNFTPNIDFNYYVMLQLIDARHGTNLSASHVEVELCNMFSLLQLKWKQKNMINCRTSLCSRRRIPIAKSSTMLKSWPRKYDRPQTKRKSVKVNLLGFSYCWAALQFSRQDNARCPITVKFIEPYTGILFDAEGNLGYLLRLRCCVQFM